MNKIYIIVENDTVDFNSTINTTVYKNYNLAKEYFINKCKETKKDFIKNDIDFEEENYDLKEKELSYEIYENGRGAENSFCIILEEKEIKE